MSAAFSLPRHDWRKIDPVDNSDDVLVVVPNPNGSWALKFEHDPDDKRMGHFPDAEAAYTAAIRCCKHVRRPTPLPHQEPLSTLQNPETKFLKLLSES